MRTLEYRNSHVPAFLTKLWKLVTDPTSDDLISWSLGGTSFVIFDEIRFSKELLPMYFKHNNMASFVRQLNMYGFRKLSCIEQGGMHCIKNEIEFYHQYFIKGQESLLELIKRKIPSNKSTDDPKIKQEYINELISNLKSLQGRQENAEEGMKNLKRENKLLWRQLTLLNGRYLKQQAMLQQLVPFFMNMVHSSHRVALKRKSPLMIHEGESEEKVPCTTSYFVEQQDTMDMTSSTTSSPGNVSNRGPVIHDVTEMETSKMFANNILCSSNSSKENEVIVDSPLSNSLESTDHTMDSPFTNADTMEPLNVLNCTFESISPSNSCADINPVSRNIAVSPVMLVQDTSNVTDLPPVSPHMGVMNSMTSTMQAPLPPVCSPEALQCTNSNSSYVCQTPSHCGSQSMSVMDMLNEVSNQSCSMPPENYASPIQTATDYSWLQDTASGTEQNIDSWLGQIFKTDNLSPGCSLPLRHVGPNI